MRGRDPRDLQGLLRHRVSRMRGRQLLWSASFRELRESDRLKLVLRIIGAR